MCVFKEYFTKNIFPSKCLCVCVFLHIFVSSSREPVSRSNIIFFEPRSATAIFYRMFTGDPQKRRLDVIFIQRLKKTFGRYFYATPQKDVWTLFLYNASKRRLDVIFIKRLKKDVLDVIVYKTPQKSRFGRYFYKTPKKRRLDVIFIYRLKKDVLDVIFYKTPQKRCFGRYFYKTPQKRRLNVIFYKTPQKKF